MLFIIMPNETMFESNPHLSSMPEFEGITDAQMRFVAFYSDWRSPYSKLEQKERKMRAMDAAGLEDDAGTEKYISEYMKIQGIEEEFKSIDSMNNAIANLRAEIDKGGKDIEKNTKTLISTIKSKRVLEQLINEYMNIQDVGVIETESFSTMDQYHNK